MMGRRHCERLIVALDFTALSPALRMARRLRGVVRTVKVGSALFTACGPEGVRRLRALGFEVMLDLKFFDIPSTVELSCRAATRLRVAFLTVHAKGGRRMLEAAIQGVCDEAKRANLASGQRPRVLAVTVLTSVPVPPAMRGGPQTAGGQRAMEREVLDLVGVALAARCDGVVASPREAAQIRHAFRDARFQIVCPGIRPSWAFPEDQRRIATPVEALAAGADRIVVGRPITGARNPRAATEAMLEEMKGARAC